MTTPDYLMHYNDFAKNPIDGIPPSWPSGTLRPFLQIIVDDIRDARGAEYMPISYSVGDLCEMCWLKLGYRTGKRHCRVHK